MSQILIKILSKTKLTLYSNHVIRNIKYFQTLQTTYKLRNTNFLYKYRILKPRATINIHQIRNNLDVNLEVDTNVVNNVMLYKYESPRYFKFLTVFSVFQFSLFAIITYFLIDWLPEFKADESIFAYLKRNFLYTVTFILPFVGGVGSSVIIWLFTIRSIKYIILLKGGKKVTMVTYHPWKDNFQFTVPVEEVYVRKHRQELNRIMTLGIKNKPFYFMLNNDGTFVNPDLYDHAIGYYKK